MTEEQERRLALLSDADYFWYEKDDIDRCYEANDIYREFPTLARAFTNYKMAKRAVDAELLLLKREHDT